MTNEICILGILIILNAFLVMSELAIVSSRPAKLKKIIRQDSKKSSQALELNADPGKFLSTIQIGITLIGILSGTFSGATLGKRLGMFLTEIGISSAFAEPIGMIIVIATITYISITIGELVPKQIALRYKEAIAIKIAPGIFLLSQISKPVVWIFDYSVQNLLRLFDQDGLKQELVTDEEIKLLVEEAEDHGTIESDERRMIAGVMRLGDRAVRALMTPRTEIEWINLDATEENIKKLLISTQHSKLPAGEKNIDSMIGVIQTRDLLAAALSNHPFEPRKYLRTVPIVHDQADALDILNILKNSDIPVALVHDEYGHFEGIVTPADILKTITGVFRSDLDPNEEEDHPVKREDGSWLLPGCMPVDEMADLLGITLKENRDYETIAGFLLSHLNHLPETGEILETDGWKFEIVDLDCRRIDRIIAKKIHPEE